MKYIRAAMLCLGWCFTLAAGETITHAGTEPFHPVLPPPPPPEFSVTFTPDSLESWTRRLENDFFRLRVGGRSTAVGGWMPARAFNDHPTPGMAAAGDPFRQEGWTVPSPAAAQTVGTALSFDWNRWLRDNRVTAAGYLARRPELAAPALPDLPASVSFNGQDLSARANALLQQLPALPSAPGWPAGAPDFQQAADRLAAGLPTELSFHLSPLAGDSFRRLDAIAPPDWSRWRAQTDSAVNAVAGRLHGWLEDPATATRIDRWRAQADGVFDFLDRLRAESAFDPGAAGSQFDRGLAALVGAEHRLPPALQAQLGTLPSAEQLHARLDGALAELFTGRNRQRVDSVLDQLAGLRGQLDAVDTTALLGRLNAGVSDFTARYPAAADRLQAQLPTTALTPGAWLAPAANGGWDFRLQLPALGAAQAQVGAWQRQAQVGVQSLAGAWNAAVAAPRPTVPALSTTLALPSLPAWPSAIPTAGLPALDGVLGDLDRRLTGAAGVTNGLQLAVDRLQVAPNAVAAQRIEFGLGATHFSLQNGYFGQTRNAFQGRDTYLYVGPTELSLPGGTGAGFRDFRLQFSTAPDAFLAAASVDDLSLRLGRQQLRFDAVHLALQGDRDSVALRGIVFPHDDLNRGGAALYFELASRDLQMLGLAARAESAFTARDLNALAALLTTRPKLLSDQFLVAFNGRAAQLLESQWSERLDGGTRLLIDALSGFDDGYRTVAIRGNQVARMKELASGRQYSTLVESAREVVPEIDLLYSHYLRRFGGRPDCLAAPCPVLRFGPFDGVIGAAEGEYATQFFGGLSYRLPGGGAVLSQRMYAGWLYEQAGLAGADSPAAYPQYAYERAGFLQYRYNGWALAYEGRLQPAIGLGAGRRAVFDTLLDLGVRQADDLSFANTADFAKPREFLGRYDQSSPLGNLFPIFHAESHLRLEWLAAARAASVGVGCDADFGYGKVTRGLGLQLPLVPELTPKAYVTLARPQYRVQFMGAWPTAADQVPYVACQFTWDLNQFTLEW